jgi:flagellar biosynthesis protein FlhG
MASDHVLVVTTPEPAAMMDAYAMIKVLVMRRFAGRISVVVNMAESVGEGKRICRQIARVARQFLGAQVYEGGVLLRDERLRSAVRRQIPVVLAYPRAPVTAAFAAMAARLARDSVLETGQTGFFRKVANWFM